MASFAHEKGGGLPRQRWDPGLSASPNCVHSILWWKESCQYIQMFDTFYSEATRSYSFDAQIGKAQNKAHLSNEDCALIETAVMEHLKAHPEATQVEVAAAIGKSRRSVQNAIAALKGRGLVKREGARMNGRWIVMR